jgi:Domain of unknown function (DUF2017)
VGDDGAGQLSSGPRHSPLWCSGPGQYQVELGAEERALLRELPMQLRDAIAANRQDEAFRRLFPPGYSDNPEAEADFRSLVGQELEESKAQALETLAKTADSTELTEEEMDAWLRALNDIRLWLGTLLDVGEDETVDEPEDPPHLLYHVLTAIQSLVIDALSGEP